MEKDITNSDDTKQLTPQEQKLATKGIPRLVLTYSIPTIIGMLVNALYVVVDRFFIGQIPDIGPDALAGIGLAAPITNITFSFSLMLGVGAAASISIALGNRNREKAERILGNTLALNVLFAIILTIVVSIFLEDPLIAVGATYATLPFALAYTRIMIFGLILSFMSFAMNHPIRASGNPKRFASAQMLGAVLNTILSPLFIFTFSMGIEGAAYATILSQGITAVWVMSFYLGKRFGGSTIKIRLKNLMPDPKIILTICAIGIAPFFMQVLASTVIIVANNMLLHYGYIEFGNGDMALGAFTVISSVAMIFIMPVFGINQGTQPIIGFNYGAGNIARVKQAYRYAVMYALVLTVLGVIIVLALAPQLMLAFGGDPLMTEIGSVGMRIMLFTMPIAGFQGNTAGFFMAIGRAKVSLMLSVLRQGLILIPLYFILPLLFGFIGIWYATPIADIISAGITFVMIFKEFKKLDARLVPQNI